MYLRDKYLVLILLFVLLLTGLTILGLCLGDPFYMKTSTYDDNYDYQYCTSNRQYTLYVPVIQTARFIILAFMSIVAYKIRKIPDFYNETRQLVFTIYNLTFLSIALTVLDLVLDRGQSVSLIVYCMTIFTICVTIILIMFVPKIIMMKMKKPSIHCPSSTFQFDATNITPAAPSI